MYPRNNGQSCTYQQAFQAVGIRTQQSVQTYSELKCDFSEAGRFKLRMCVIAAVGFVLNLIFTISLMIFLLSTRTPPKLRGDEDIIRCSLPERYGGPISVGDDRCSRLTKEAIRKAVLEDCDENSNDEIRVHPKNCANFTKDESTLTQWEIGLNQSSVSLDAHGQFTVHYSGVYILQSSLAFECKDRAVHVEGNERGLYWHEVQVQNATRFSDAEMIQPHSLQFRPSFCYRSYIYAVLRLQAKDSFRIRAGPTALIHCTRAMSYLALYRP